MSSETARSGYMNNKKLLIGGVIAAVFIAMMAFILFEGTKKTVLLTADGEQIEVYTHAKTVEDVLTEQEIDLAKHDYVSPAKTKEVEDGSEIEWIPAQELAVVVDGEEEKIWTTKSTVREVLDEAGVEVNEHDEISPALSASVKDAEAINVTKAMEVKLVDGGKERVVWSTPTSVKELLEREKVALQGDDRLDGLSLDDPIQAEKAIEVLRIDRERNDVEIATEFDVEKREDASLPEGQTKIIQEGQKGKKVRTYEVTMKNGERVMSEVVDEKVISEPKKKVIAVGTKKPEPKPEPKVEPKPEVATNNNATNKAPAKNTTPSRDNSKAPSGGREFYVEATAYTPYCTGCSGISAAGINLRANPNMKLIAADPRVIPMGTKVWVEGYGHAVVGDTGGAIKGNRIDVLMPTKAQAYKWGRKQVKIKILN